MRFPVNTTPAERVGSALLAAASIAAGFWFGGRVIWLGLAIGASLVFRAVSGHCLTYRWLGINRCQRKLSVRSAD